MGRRPARPASQGQSLQPFAQHNEAPLGAANPGESAQPIASDPQKDEALEWGRNPFLTPEEETKKPSLPDGLQVKAIITGPPRSIATVDGKTIMVGDKVGEEIVREIHSDSVVLERAGEKRILRVSEPVIEIQVREGKR
jgi:hypothetical protein